MGKRVRSSGAPRKQVAPTSSVRLPKASGRSSLLVEIPAGDPKTAFVHFISKLSFETDSADVYVELNNGAPGFIVLDARTPEVYARGHVPGAINLPHRQMNASTTASLPKDKVIVVYCDGIGCNASTKGATKLAALGFRAKEMLGGLDWWKRDGYPVETTAIPVKSATLARC